jgi:hypothetical protein
MKPIDCDALEQLDRPARLALVLAPQARLAQGRDLRDACFQTSAPPQTDLLPVGD